MKKIFLLVVGFFLVISNSYASKVQGITPVSVKSVDVSFSDDVVLSDSDLLKPDIKILKDLVVDSVYRDASNLKKIIINLNYDLQEGNSYSLLSVSGAKGDVDFDVKEIPSQIYVNNNFIDIINIVDSKNIEISYKDDLTGEEFVYEILEDLGVESAKIKGSVLTLNTVKDLEKFASYILLVNKLLDSNGEDIKLEEVYYDFTTSEYLEGLDEETVEQEIKEENINSEKIQKALDKEVKNQKEEKGNIEEIAMNSAKKTPSTGTETTILILFTALLTGFFVIKSRK